MALWGSLRRLTSFDGHFIIVVLLVVLIAIFRVQDAYKAHAKPKHPGEQPEEDEAGFLWFPEDVGGGGGRDRFNGGDKDGEEEILHVSDGEPDLV
jgi:hypothetical protein